MMYDFNADDIFEMAEQMERNGANFYRTAAQSVGDQGAKDFLVKLAEMEDDHEKTFAKMRSTLKADEKASTVFDPEGEAVRYLRALADTRVFFEKEIDTSSMEAILKDAITAEKDSIVFYLGMRDAVPEKMGRNHLDDIIKEDGPYPAPQQRIDGTKKIVPFRQTGSGSKAATTGLYTLPALPV